MYSPKERPLLWRSEIEACCHISGAPSTTEEKRFGNDLVSAYKKASAQRKFSSVKAAPKPLYPLVIKLFDKYGTAGESSEIGQLVLCANHALNLKSYEEDWHARLFSCWQSLRKQKVLFIESEKIASFGIRRESRLYPAALLIVLERVYGFATEIDA